MCSGLRVRLTTVRLAEQVDPSEMFIKLTNAHPAKAKVGMMPPRYRAADPTPIITLAIPHARARFVGSSGA
jgi:hypothetical protein